MNIKRICTMVLSMFFVGGTNYFIGAMDDKKKQESKTCVLCSKELKWEELNEGVLPTIETSPCRHSFHRPCLQEYIKKHGGGKCPVCNEDMNKDNWLVLSGLKTSTPINLYEVFRLLPGLTLGDG